MVRNVRISLIETSNKYFDYKLRQEMCTKYKWIGLEKKSDVNWLWLCVSMLGLFCAVKDAHEQERRWYDQKQLLSLELKALRNN